MDWRKVAISLNAMGHDELGRMAEQTSETEALEFRIRGFLLIALAGALLDGLDEHQKDSN